MCKSSVYFSVPSLKVGATSLCLVWRRFCSSISYFFSKTDFEQYFLKSARAEGDAWLRAERDSAQTQGTWVLKQGGVTTRLPPTFTNEMSESDVGY